MREGVHTDWQISDKAIEKDLEEQGVRMILCSNTRLKLYRHNLVIQLSINGGLDELNYNFKHL